MHPNLRALRAIFPGTHHLTKLPIKLESRLHTPENLLCWRYLRRQTRNIPASCIYSKSFNSARKKKRVINELAVQVYLVFAF